MERGKTATDWSSELVGDECFCILIGGRTKCLKHQAEDALTSYAAQETADLRREVAELKRDINDFKELHKMIMDRVMPGVTDSVETVRGIVKELAELQKRWDDHEC